MAVAKDVLQLLTARGIRYVFCCPGTTEIPLLDEWMRDDPEYDRPEFILTTHEAISVSMADGFARASGSPSVAYLHTNVGLANGLAHLYAAREARSPVVVLVGLKPTPTLPHRALTTSRRQLEAVADYAGFIWQNLRAEDIPADLGRAIAASIIAPESPAVLAIPQDHLASLQRSDDAPSTPLCCSVRPATRDVKLAADLLHHARRLVIIAGSDIARRGAESELERLASMLSASVFVESRRDMERWSFSTEHPCFAGVFDPRDEVATHADLVFLAGAPTPLEFSPESPILPVGVPVLHLSEDPRETVRRLDPAGVLVGDTKLALQDLIEVLELGDYNIETASRLQHLSMAQDALTNRQATWRREVPAAGAGDRFSAATAMLILADEAGGEQLLVVDAVTSTLPLFRFLRRSRRDSLFATASGSLGWGMGAALGVALAKQERVIAVVGDGVVQFGLPALWTARRYNIPVTYVVVANGLYQAVASDLVNSGEPAPFTAIGEVDYHAIAESFGIRATRVSSAEEFQRALHTESGRPTADGPALIEVLVNDQLWP